MSWIFPWPIYWARVRWIIPFLYVEAVSWIPNFRHISSFFAKNVYRKTHNICSAHLPIPKGPLEWEWSSGQSYWPISQVVWRCQEHRHWCFCYTGMHYVFHSQVAIRPRAVACCFAQGIRYSRLYCLLQLGPVEESQGLWDKQVRIAQLFLAAYPAAGSGRRRDGESDQGDIWTLLQDQAPWIQDRSMGSAPITKDHSERRAWWSLQEVWREVPWFGRWWDPMPRVLGWS